MTVARDGGGVERVLTVEGTPVARLSDLRIRVNQGLMEARKK
jgi:antitoxin (DNA-binding transcriptional repressor) of toxin-antitoxin stability system